MLPLVLIDVGSPSGGPKYGAAMAAACSRAVPRGRCVLAGSERDLRPSAIAIVSWQGSQQQSVQIQVGTRSAGRTRWVSRQMHFSAADAPIERWRAVGLTVATLVGAQSPERRAPAPKPRPVAAPHVSRAASRKPIWVDLAALTGPGLETGAWRVGGRLAGAYALPELPAFVGLSLAYAVRDTDAHGISVGFLTLSGEAGAALKLPTFPVELDASGGLELEQIHASVDRGGLSDSGTRWVPGLRGRLAALYPVHGSLAGFLGVEGWVQTNPTEIRVRDAPVERVLGAGLCLELGVRARMP